SAGRDRGLRVRGKAPMSELRSDTGASDFRAHSRHRKGAGEDMAVPPAAFRSYYGRPILKPPAWNWMIAAYLFTGGLSAGSALLGARVGRAGRTPVPAVALG